jgi:hypothetical protein
MNTKKSILAGMAICLSGILLSGCKDCGKDALQVTKAFARLHGGDAWNRPGKGTVKTRAGCFRASGSEARTAEDRFVPAAVAPEMDGTVQRAGFFGLTFWLILAGAGIGSVFFLIKRLDPVQMGINAVEKTTDEAKLQNMAQSAKNGKIREAAIRQITRAQKRLLLSEHVQLFLAPEEAVMLGNSRKNYLACEHSCATKINTDSWKKTVVVLGEQSEGKIHLYETSRAGWSLAALGRMITQDCTPERFKASVEEYRNKTLPDYLELFKDLDGRGKYLLKLQGEFTDLHDRFTLRMEEGDAEEKKRLSRMLKDPLFRQGLSAPAEKADGETPAGTLEYLVHRMLNLKTEIETLDEEFMQMKPWIDKGMLAYADEKGVLPFAFFMMVMVDSQGHFDPFVRQCAIMGMVDFLTEHRTNPLIKPYFESLNTMRRRMISSGSQQVKYFEVRVPVNCTAGEYAAILKEVIHCANPDIPCGDMELLMEIAEREIPGVLDFLYHYPLRLIDPGHKATGGFSRFEPYRHVRWVHHTPPDRTGEVLSRYHEVMDLTLPNSAGLNIQLFTDSYAAVPVLFHEYCRYMEDLNEASVCLRTYLFSLDFYGRYKEASPGKDAVFTELNRLLGKSPDPGRLNDLNSLIEKYYGKTRSGEEAMRTVKDELRRENAAIKQDNARETWCPKIKLPLLNKNGDRATADLIKKIYVRYAQLPRTVTQDEFEKIKADYMPVQPEVYARYLASVPDMFARLDEKKEGERIILSYAGWTGFRDWCIRENYIMPYPENGEEFPDEDDGEETAPNTMEELLHFNRGYRDMLLKFPGKDKSKSKNRKRS